MEVVSAGESLTNKYYRTNVKTFHRIILTFSHEGHFLSLLKQFLRTCVCNQKIKRQVVKFLFFIRPYIIVKKGQPMVKNNHIEDLSQGYR